MNKHPDSKLRDAETAAASDIEQRLGHGGNLRDGGQGAEAPRPRATDPVGGSGHVPQLEEINPGALDESTGSAGADADRRAGSGQA